jgi:signal peptide peptidase SppA
MMSLIDKFNELAVRFAGPIVRKNSPIVSVVKLSGIIGSAGFGRKGINLADLEIPLRRAFSKRGVDAVALKINSPGGSPVQSEMIANRIRQLSDEKDIPVYAFVEDLAASGGYWLACSADEIYVSSMSIVGSIGVISASFGFNQLMDKIGIERRIYSQGKNKSMLDPFRPEEPQHIERLLRLQEDIHNSFMGYVKERRVGKLTDTDENLFNGDIWTGNQAKEVGLVDEIGDIRSVIQEKFGVKTKFIQIPLKSSWLQKTLSGESYKTSKETRVVDELISSIEERLIWSRYDI